MDVIVHYLNALNQPYRSAQKDFHWNVLRDNCAYLAHNALAAVGLWPELRTDRPLLVAAFDFPVPEERVCQFDAAHKRYADRRAGCAV